MDEQDMTKQQADQESMASAHREESETRCLGEIYLDWFMSEAREIGAGMKELLNHDKKEPF